MAKLVSMRGGPLRGEVYWLAKGGGGVGVHFVGLQGLPPRCSRRLVAKLVYS